MCNLTLIDEYYLINDRYCLCNFIVIWTVVGESVPEFVFLVCCNIIYPGWLLILLTY